MRKLIAFPLIALAFGASACGADSAEDNRPNDGAPYKLVEQAETPEGVTIIRLGEVGYARVSLKAIIASCEKERVGTYIDHQYAEDAHTSGFAEVRCAPVKRVSSHPNGQPGHAR